MYLLSNSPVKRRIQRCLRLKLLGKEFAWLSQTTTAQLRDKVLQLLTPEYEVVGTAGDGKAALEAISLLKPDIILLDISMPVMNGIEVAAEIKDSNTPAKVVFLTVHEDSGFSPCSVKGWSVWLCRKIPDGD